MLRSYLEMIDYPVDKAKDALCVFRDLGHVRINDQKFILCDRPCRLCGGTGHIIRPKMSGYVHDDCPKCNGKGYRPIDPDDDTILE